MVERVTRRARTTLRLGAWYGIGRSRVTIAAGARARLRPQRIVARAWLAAASGVA
jgi:hypothetical protein